jgi:transposase
VSKLTALQIEPIRLGGMPIAWKFSEQLRINEVFAKHVPADPRDKLSVASTLSIALINVILERFPLYKIGEWARERRLLDEKPSDCLNDDRVGRALDRLFRADRAAILTEIVLRAIEVFDLDTSRVHNDSTTVTLTGEYLGYAKSKAAKPKRGHNKDHRPDLKQLLFSLSVLGDGAVPLYFKVWDGNITDDRTHIKNWMALRGLLGRVDFTYVTDSKLCTRENMEFIDSEGGLFVTVMPQTRAEDRRFKDWIQDQAPQWQEVIRRPDPKRKYAPQHVYWTFESPFPSSEGFRIIWVRSSQKQSLDAASRTRAVEKTEQDLSDLSSRNLRNRDKLESTIQEILTSRKTGQFFKVQIEARVQEQYRQERKGRPTKNTRYRKTEKKSYGFTWEHDQAAIRYAAKCDGLFPLITNRKDPAKEILKIYKFQPRLERRHSQLKSVYDVRPVFLKNPERIEALLFLYFLALLIDGLVERETRKAMKLRNLDTVPIYPEARACNRPTANKIFDLFRDVRLHRVITPGHTQYLPDDLSPVQRQVLDLLKLPVDKFFETPR